MQIKKVLKYLTKHSTLAQRLYRAYRRAQRSAQDPDWTKMLGTDGQWERAREAAKNGPVVLLATSAGGHVEAPIIDTLLAVALTQRGASVKFLLCDSFLPACHLCEIGLVAPDGFSRRGPQGYFCNGCFDRGNRLYGQLGLSVLRYSSHVSPEEKRQAEELSASTPEAALPMLSLDGVNVGEHALAGTLRYFARANLEGQSQSTPIMRRYLQGAILTSTVVRNVIQREKVGVVCVNHGIYVPHGLVAETARKQNVRVVAWNVAYRKRSFIFSHNETYHHSLMTEPVSEWTEMKWTDQQEKEVENYLRSRRTGGRDWIAFHSNKSEQDVERIRERLTGFDPKKPLIGMLTNVAWDAQLHYPANAFSDMLDWIVQTIRYFSKRPDLQLVIRIHPAEVSGDIPSRQPVSEEVRRAFPVLPKNIFVIAPGELISTYPLMEACDSVLIYGTKTGVELATLGIPVIVAGEAWIRGKGIATEASSVQQYFAMLDRLPRGSRLSAEQVRRAKQYAYHFFFRRMIPVDQLCERQGEPKFTIEVKHATDLAPGKSGGLDVICDGILRGTPFTYRAEMSAPAAAKSVAAAPATGGP